YCIIETSLNATGEVVQTSDFDKLFFGELNGTNSDRAKLIEDTFANTKSEFILTSDIMRGMWQKYLMITVLSSVTTMMHAPIGQYVIVKVALILSNHYMKKFHPL